MDKTFFTWATCCLAVFSSFFSQSGEISQSSNSCIVSATASARGSSVLSKLPEPSASPGTSGASWSSSRFCSDVRDVVSNEDNLFWSYLSPMLLSRSAFILRNMWGFFLDTTFASERYFLYFPSSRFSSCFCCRCCGSLSVTVEQPRTGHNFFLRHGFLQLTDAESLVNFHCFLFPTEAVSLLENVYFFRNPSLDVTVLADALDHSCTSLICLGRWRTTLLQCGKGHFFFCFLLDVLPWPSLPLAFLFLSTHLFPSIFLCSLWCPFFNGSLSSSSELLRSSSLSSYSSVCLTSWSSSISLKTSSALVLLPWGSSCSSLSDTSKAEYLPEKLIIVLMVA